MLLTQSKVVILIGLERTGGGRYKICVYRNGKSEKNFLDFKIAFQKKSNFAVITFAKFKILNY